MLAEIEQHGTGWKWETAEKYTKEFQDLYKDHDFDGDWFDKLDEFLYRKANELNWLHGK